MMNKKGFGRKQLVNLITFLLVAIILFAAWKVLYPVLKGSGEDTACRAFMLANSATGDKGGGKKFFSMPCKRKQLEIDQEDFDKGVAEQKVSNLLVTCWKNMGEGEHEQFESRFIGVSDHPCLICGNISFDEDVSEESVSGFVQHLKDREYGDDSVWEEIYGANFQEDSPVLAWDGKEFKTGDIRTSKDYYMVYHAYSPAVATEVLEPVLPFLEKPEKPSISLVSAEDLRWLKCDYFYN